MKKLTLIFMLLLSVSIHTGCGSSPESSDEGDTASAEATDSGGEEAEGEDVASGEEGEDGEEAEGEVDGEVQNNNDGMVADLGEGATNEADLPPDGSESPEAAATTESQATDGDQVAAAAPPTETTEVAPEPMAEPEQQQEPVAVAEEPPPAPVSAPYLKIKDSTYKSHDRLMNTVYLARPGDTLEGVAQKTGAQKSHLLADNPILKRGVKPGDKIYFMSSHRPDDAAAMLTYYEDKGLPPQVYVTKDGDNIRTFSKDLLGHPNAWKEVWATNSNVESKDVVPPGIELKYWPNDSSAQAANTLPQEPPVASDSAVVPPPPPPQDVAMNAAPPPPADQLPPPPPPVDDFAAAGTVDIAPPPPPMKKPTMEALDNDTTMALGVAAILLVAAAALFAVIMKRSRSKKIKLSQTQV